MMGVFEACKAQSSEQMTLILHSMMLPSSRAIVIQAQVNLRRIFTEPTAANIR